MPISKISWQTEILWNEISFNDFILVKQPVTSANKGRIICTMSIINMDPFFITNLHSKQKWCMLEIFVGVMLIQET